MTAQETEKKQGSANFPEGNQAGSQDDTDDLPLIWKKIEILGRPIGALITALAVASIGWFSQSWLSLREEEITKRAEIQQDTRLYTELMSRREEAESSLRMGMFSAILAEFLKSSSTTENLDNLRNRLLKLELLALNFGDSLSLSPLFIQLAAEIEADLPISNWTKEQNNLRKRLRSLARRVSGAQLAALIPVGDVLEIDVPLGQIEGDNRYIWPDDQVRTDQRILGKENDRNWVDDVIESNSKRSLQGIERIYQLVFSEADRILNTVKVDLLISESPENDKPENVRPVEASFKLNFFNFPMVDNTRLSGDQRFSLVLEKFDVENENLHIVGICFPGNYASLRDKPFLEDIIQKLKQKEGTIKM